MKTLNTILFILTFSLYISAQSVSTMPSIEECISNLASDDPKEVYSYINKLKSFSYDKFSATNKAELNRTLNQDTPHVDCIIELCGFLQMEEELKAYAQNNKLSKRMKQTLNLALVRAGDQDKLQNLLKNLKEIDVSDDYAYNLVPKLVYTTQKPVFDYLLNQIMEENIVCKHPDMETSGTFDCANPMIEAIAPYIEDFPFDVNQFGIVSKNPSEILPITRKWINDNMDKYSINKNTY
jgi:hypothetical protein